MVRPTPLGPLTPAPIPGLGDNATATSSLFYAGASDERPLNVIGFASEADELEARALARQEAREHADDYHRRGMRAREIAATFKDYAAIGRVVQHDQTDYVGFRYTATTPHALNGTPFDTRRYDFDDIIWKDSNIDGLGNANNVSTYPGYAAMRMNVSIVRNVIYNQYFPDGQFDANDPTDVENQKKIVEIAHFLGRGIRDGAFLTAALPQGGDAMASAVAMPVNQANRPDHGARSMYDFLLDRQKTHITLPVNGLFATPVHDWALQPVHLTALSDDAQQSFFDATSDLHDVMERLHDHLAGHAESIKRDAILAANALSRPEDLPRQTQAVAVREARIILDRFRAVYDTAEKGLGGKNPAEHHHEVFLPMESVSLSKYAGQLSHIYLQNLSALLQNGGAMDAELQRVHGSTVEAMGRLAFGTRNQAVMALGRDMDDPFFKEKLTYLNDTFGRDGAGHELPDAWRTLHPDDKHPMLSTVNQLEKGIEEVNARLRQREQSQGTDGIGRGEEMINTGRSHGTPTTSTMAAGNLPQHLLNNHMFLNATSNIRQSMREGDVLDQERRAKESKAKKNVNANDRDGNGIDDRQQANLQPATPTAGAAPGLQAAQAAQQPPAQAAPQNRPPGQNSQRQQSQKQAQAQQVQSQQQARQAQKEVDRLVRAAQKQARNGAAAGNAQAAQKPRAASMWNGFTAKVNTMVNNKLAAQNRTAAPSAVGATGGGAGGRAAGGQGGFSGSTTTRIGNGGTVVVTTSQPATITVNGNNVDAMSSAREPGPTSPPPAVFDASAPGAYLPPKPGSSKARGI